MIKPETSDFFGNELDKAKLEIASYWKDKYEKTQKALEIAVDALKRANNTYCAEEEDAIIDLTESAAHKWQRTAYQMEMPISIAL